MKPNLPIFNNLIRSFGSVQKHTIHYPQKTIVRSLSFLRIGDDDDTPRPAGCPFDRLCHVLNNTQVFPHSQKGKWVNQTEMIAVLLLRFRLN
jgi:hypothetical protein